MPLNFTTDRWDCHVDYFTATTRGDIEYTALQRVERAIGAVSARYAPVEDLRERSLLGYSGRGNSICFLGRRGDGWLVRVSGAGAHEFARHVDPVLWFCSRCDIAVDVWIGYDPDQVIQSAFEQAIASREASSAGFRRRVRLVDSGGDGNTLYLGARTSQVFSRLYNKGAESGDERYFGCLRLECQYNGATAREVSKALDLRQFDRGAMVAAVVSCIGKAGVPIDISTGGVRPLEWSVDAPKTDDLKQVKWLREQVGPTARRLEHVFGKGSVMSILGLDDEV